MKEIGRFQQLLGNPFLGGILIGTAGIIAAGSPGTWLGFVPGWTITLLLSTAGGMMIGWGLHALRETGSRGAGGTMKVTGEERRAE